MSQRLIDHSPDLKKLRDLGYAIEIKDTYLYIGSVPYLNASKQVKLGTLVSTLTVAGEVAEKPEDHVAHFIGEYPCNANGSPIEEIRHPNGCVALAGVGNNFSFSAKPKTGYTDYFHKMTTYIAILASPAQSVDPTLKPQVFPVYCELEEDSPFKYFDSASSRAGISAVNDKLAMDKLAIVGSGGTGSYILDFAAKTPVKEIHLFDGDILLNHNAFRAPGAPSVEQLDLKPKKVAYFAEIYSRMRWKIFPHDFYIDEATVEQLQGFNFVFLCIDGGPLKKLIVERLEQWNIPFIDVGMGVQLVKDALRGTIATTASTPQSRDKARLRMNFSDTAVEDDYSRNIQIVELNALNAAIAVIKWKKLFGFYHDTNKEHFSANAVSGNVLINEDML